MSDQKNKVEKQGFSPVPTDPFGQYCRTHYARAVYRKRVQPRRLPTDAPNILIVLIDDAGPALPATFGGEVQTPTMDLIAKEGVAYSRFHTTAMCSPTRASLLTGRNHHRVETGRLPNSRMIGMVIPASFPGAVHWLPRC